MTPLKKPARYWVCTAALAENLTSGSYAVSERVDRWDDYRGRWAARPPSSGWQLTADKNWRADVQGDTPADALAAGEKAIQALGAVLVAGRQAKALQALNDWVLVHEVDLDHGPIAERLAQLVDVP